MSTDWQQQVLSMPWFGVISRCDFCLYLPWLAGADQAYIFRIPVLQWLLLV